jgi:hypothetical protein
MGNPFDKDPVYLGISLMHDKKLNWKMKEILVDNFKSLAL